MDFFLGTEKLMFGNNQLLFNHIIFQIAEPNKLSEDKDLAQKVWIASERDVKLKNDEIHY